MNSTLQFGLKCDGDQGANQFRTPAVGPSTSNEHLFCQDWCCCEGSLMQKLKPDFEIALLVVTTARNMCSQPAIAARKLLKRELARMLGWEGARDKSQVPFRA